MICSNISWFCKWCKNISHLWIATILLGLLSSQLRAQPPFPLAKGNAWHYTITFMVQFPYPTESYTIRVVGDSLMPNGKRYWIFDSPDMFGGRYIRSDSEYVYYWQYNHYDTTWGEQRTFNLRDSSSPTDTIDLDGFRTVTAGSPVQQTVFGKLTDLREFGLGDLI